MSDQADVHSKVTVGGAQRVMGPPVSGGMVKFTFMPRLRAANDAPDGSVWKITIIKAGPSLNGPIYPANVLKESAHIFSDVPIFAFIIGNTLTHAPQGARDQTGRDFFGNVVGRIKNPVWEMATESIIGEAHIFDERTKGILLNAWKAGEDDFAGLSIDARGIKPGNIVIKLTGANSVDLVTNPAAGGSFDRLVADIGIQEQAEFTNTMWDGSAARFTVDQLARSVPKAVLQWAERQAEASERGLIKAELKLPFKEPSGAINLNGVRAALAVLGGARGGVDLPQDVQGKAKAELQDLLRKGNEALAEDLSEALQEGVKLGQRIRAQRRQLGLSLQEAAEKVGEPLSVYSQIESGEIIRPQVECLQLFASGLGLDLDQLTELAQQDFEERRAVAALEGTMDQTAMAEAVETTPTDDPVEGAPEEAPAEEAPAEEPPAEEAPAKEPAKEEVPEASKEESLSEANEVAKGFTKSEAAEHVEPDASLKEQDVSPGTVGMAIIELVDGILTGGIPAEEFTGVLMKIKATASLITGITESTPSANPAPQSVEVAAAVDSTTVQEESMDEITKLQADLTEAQERAEKAETALAEKEAEMEVMRESLKSQSMGFELSKLAEEMNIVDKDAAAKLINPEMIKFSEDFKVEGLKEALEDLVTRKPFMVSSTEAPSGTEVALTESVETGQPEDILMARMKQLVPLVQRGDTRAAAEMRQIRQGLS